MRPGNLDRTWRGSSVRKVLLITFDQWRADALSLAGHRHALTPNIDAFAAEAVAFENHFTASAPCGPSRATLLTGLYPFNHRSVRNGTPLDARHTNLALQVRDRGLTPYLFGYTDTSLDPRTRPPGDPALRVYESVLDGFEIGCRMSGAAVPMNEWAAHLARRGHAIPANHPDLLYGLGALAAGEPVSRRPAFYRAEDSDTAFLAGRICDFLLVAGGYDWLVHASFLRPHPPLIAPAPYNTAVDPADIALPVREPDRAAAVASHPFLAYWLEVVQASPSFFQKNFNPDRLTPDDIRLMRAVYFGLIQECDANFGRMIDALKETGLYDETLIVLTSDHGEMLGDHWMWGKGGYFDASYRIPLLVRDPLRSAHAGRRVRAFTESVDVAPTIIDWLGGTPPVSWDGRSLLPFLSGDTPPWRDAVFWEYDFREPVTRAAERHLGLTSAHCVLNVLRDEKGKYVHFNGLPPLFFDLAAGPDELEPSRAALADGRAADYCARLLSRRMTHAERVLVDTLLTPDGPVRNDGPRY
ncbi:MAG: sulfatase-like hydrolase/transferase [Rhizobiales bacterium]|nr:sulfatase-like hydrolase/transferase [Hyphomicrobiales bacterium]